ncbi:phosphoribosylaminoimidazolesuccinocarboxamide synthase [Thermomicrobiaceae bacterium CFH 74404]|uniref:Phosphoribosylaminoimidazole-succinocarboxamide synthase n=1 Tax=Thermalbibacter longus TaxID=2951981 RepID=A0AA41WFD4_9BACT|nr:phosphoribosylaminoimidazolesuccinocarboxamide synthase [Thermalbibacter longus]MCM8750053.1 phosphoribosylaminoimidazolesuccinocarboxamide synthase [Thermalbibacter longus]
MTARAVLEVEIPELPRFRRGKVRETFDLGDRLLMVATDRLSAFDVVLPTGIPGKGVVLTQLSRFWFEWFGHRIRSHYVTTDLSNLPPAVQRHRVVLEGRSMIVRRAERIDVECVARGYLSGSAWAEYRESGTVAGQRLPAGLVESDRLPEPLFTPAVKAESGHDRNISFPELVDLVGEELATRLREETLAIYRAAERYALDRGVIIADTKLEFGWIDGKLAVIDELLTPDSSRFWDAERYSPGRAQPSFDKQFVRDWLLSSSWNREPPGPALPDDVVEATRRRYFEAYERLTGQVLRLPDDE